MGCAEALISEGRIIEGGMPSWVESLVLTLLDDVTRFILFSGEIFAKSTKLEQAMPSKFVLFGKEVFWTMSFGVIMLIWQISPEVVVLE